jgi:pimeloyl-ACP methyl ester carboxylesterase
MELREQTARVGGIAMNYAVAGAGPPLVLVPGQSFPWQSYQKVIPALSRSFRVYAVDVRGHGKSERTPGKYTFATCGADLVAFLSEVVKEPAVVSGNSSGGLICIWAAAHAPQSVRAVLAEDPPLFSAEWPRMRDDCWVHAFFTEVVSTLPDLAGLFSRLKLPTRPGKKLISFPRPLAWVLGGAIRRRQRARPGEPVDIPWLPLQVRLFVRGLSEYDVGFTRACVDGSMCDMDHGDCVAKVRCPMLLIQASSFRDEKLGLVGAMDDDDVKRAQALKPDLEVQSWPKPHVVHIADPKAYVHAVRALAQRAAAPASRPAA